MKLNGDNPGGTASRRPPSHQCARGLGLGLGLGLRHRRPQLQRRHAVSGPGPDSNAAGAGSPALISLPLFPLPTVLHPAQSGTLLVFEPRYLELFRDLQEAAAPAGGDLRFGHILAGSSAPPALMGGDSVGGLPRLGVCAAVKSIERRSNGHLQVHYQGTRRFRLLSVDHDTRPYPQAAATWLDDEPATDAAAQQLIDSLELDVYQLLQQVAKYSQQLAAAGSSTQDSSPSSSSSTTTTTSSSSSSGSSSDSDSGSSRPGPAPGALPDAVLTFAPPPPTKKQSVAEYLTKAGVPAGGAIATWQRLGSVYSSSTSGKKKPAHDPYQLLRDEVGRERRQELFSFAAASVLELGLPERLALLQSRDTAARLQFVAAVAAPHLQDLVARASLQQALAKP